MDTPKGSGSTTFLLVGLILLLIVTGSILSFVPLVKCPSCRGRQRGFILKNGTRIEMAGILDADAEYLFLQDSDGTRRRVALADISGPWNCDRCGGRRRVSVFRRVLGRPDPATN